MADRILAALDDEQGIIYYGAVVLFTRREQGRQSETLPLLEAAVAQNPGMVTFRSALAATLADEGEFDEAREQLSALLADDLALIPRDSAWPSTLAYVATACAGLNDVACAEAIVPHLEPFTGLAIVLPADVAVIGAADRLLGMLYTILRRFDDAERSFEQALDLEARLESPPLQARTRYWFAKMLIDRDAPGDREHAQEVLKESLATAETLGMGGVAADAIDLLGSFDSDVRT